jgi:C4-dicarboxylate-binding protein DctP
MSQRLSRRLFVGTAAATLAAPSVGRAAEPVKIRCSLDTAPSHPRNQAIVDYMATLEKESKGEIKTEVFHSGQLFADLNVSKALLQGQIEMASPGTWSGCLTSMACRSTSPTRRQPASQAPM